MPTLNQPKWKKFLSLKGEEKVKNIETIPDTQSTVDNKEVSTVNGTDCSTAPTPSKKRKRTEEEIAQRKAKKLKSKGKEGQEWQKLAESHEKKLSADGAQDGTTHANGEHEPPESANSADKLNDELLSKKAKEISKARRKEKVQERQQQSQTASKAKEQQISDSKATQGEEYLAAYHKHVKTGSEWKFKKQIQNWIVRHLYDYPWKSDHLLVQYLKTVQGGARERLVTEAREVVKSAEAEDDTDDAKVEKAQKIIKALT
jgi:hypothetical protein